MTAWAEDEEQALSLPFAGALALVVVFDERALSEESVLYSLGFVPFLQVEPLPAHPENAAGVLHQFSLTLPPAATEPVRFSAYH
jgi:hypothetical protein